MGLDQNIASLEDVAEQLREHYKPNDGDVGGFSLAVVGGDEKGKAKLSEFRDRNVEQRVQIEGLERKLGDFDGIDAEKARVALNKMQKLADKQLMDEGQFEELMLQRTETMRQEYDRKVTASTGALELITIERDTLLKNAQSTAIESAARAALKGVAMVQPGVEELLVAQARANWSVGDKGQILIAVGGETTFGADGQNPQTPREWAEQLLQTVPTFFQPSQGGGASGSVSSGGTPQSNTVRHSDKDGRRKYMKEIAEGKMFIVAG